MQLWPASGRLFQLACAGFALLVTLLHASGDYGQSLSGDALILIIFGVSLQAMMALGGLVSFGHAAFFALGAYGTALTHVYIGASWPLAILAGCLVSSVVAALFALFAIRSAGVYLAMLSLALAQVVWAGASQWTEVTGGDNGLVGLNLLPDSSSGVFFGLLLVVALLSLAGLRRLSVSTFGAALQAVRDAPQRSAASGLPVFRIRYQIFVMSASLAGLAGGLFAVHKGVVFPYVSSVATSVDVLLVVLLGGLHQLWATAAGAMVLVGAAAELGRGFEYWRGALGLLVMVIMVLAPQGMLGIAGKVRRNDA